LKQEENLQSIQIENEQINNDEDNFKLVTFTKGNRKKKNVMKKRQPFSSSTGNPSKFVTQPPAIPKLKKTNSTPFPESKTNKYANNSKAKQKQQQQSKMPKEAPVESSHSNSSTEYPRRRSKSIDNNELPSDQPLVCPNCSVIWSSKWKICTKCGLIPEENTSKSLIKNEKKEMAIPQAKPVHNVDIILNEKIQQNGFDHNENNNGQKKSQYSN